MHLKIAPRSIGSCIGCVQGALCLWGRTALSAVSAPCTMGAKCGICSLVVSLEGANPATPTVMRCSLDPQWLRRCGGPRLLRWHHQAALILSWPAVQSLAPSPTLTSRRRALEHYPESFASSHAGGARPRAASSPPPLPRQTVDVSEARPPIISGRGGTH